MRRFIVAVIILFTLVFIGGCTQQQEPTQGSYIDVSPAEAKELVDSNPDLIIIYVSPHYDEGHLPGAVH